MNQPIGTNIKKIRRNRGESIEYVSRQIGLPQETYRMIEDGKLQPSDDVIKRIAKAYNVPKATILDGDIAYSPFTVLKGFLRKNSKPVLMIFFIILGISLIPTYRILKITRWNNSEKRLWGTYVSEDGDVFAIEKVEKLDNRYYHGTLFQSIYPWVETDVVVDIAKNEIIYRHRKNIEQRNLKYSIDGDDLIVNDLINIQEYKYKRTYDSMNYRTSKWQYSPEDIAGTYLLRNENVDTGCYLFIYKNGDDAVNLYIHPGIKETASTVIFTNITKDIPLQIFLYSNPINIRTYLSESDEDTIPFQFITPDVIDCPLLQYEFVKINSPMLDENEVENQILRFLQ